MSKMSELYADIELMLEQGSHPSIIALTLDCPVYFVYEVVEAIDNEMSKEELFSPFETVNS